MNEKETIRCSKFLSLVLRHEPDRIGLTLDSAGWVRVDELLERLAANGQPFTRGELDHVVSTNPKRRFAYSSDGRRIRASQGHSVAVDLRYEPVVPPATLYHGTASRFLESIRQRGLQRQQRHHVHLSAEWVVTMEVGARRGKPVLLTIDARTMHEQGHVFYQSANGVWLVEHVPPQFIRFPDPVGADVRRL